MDVDLVLSIFIQWSEEEEEELDLFIYKGERCAHVSL